MYSYNMDMDIIDMQHGAPVYLKRLLMNTHNVTLTGFYETYALTSLLS